MAETGQRRRSALRFPRVEFDLSGLVLGMAGYLLYWAIWGPLGSLLSVGRYLNLDEGKQLDTTSPGALLQREFWGTFLQKVKLPHGDTLASVAGWQPTRVTEFADGKPVGTGTAVDVPFLELPWWHYAVVAAVLLVIWSLISAALARVHAVRIARDRSIGPVAGLEFALGNLATFVLAPLFVLGAAVLFGLGVTALGALSAVPWAGPALQLVAHPLALLAGIVFTIVALGFTFGLPLTHAALATERNGYLDAVSRTFSYAFTRPLPFVFGLTVVLFVAGLLVQIGSWFVVKTSDLMILGSLWSEGADTAMTTGAIAGIQLGWPTDELSGWPWATRAVTTVFSGLAMLAVKGLALSYAIGGLTDVYFQLRAEVDGIDDSEVYLDDDEVSFGEPLAG